MGISSITCLKNVVRSLRRSNLYKLNTTHHHQAMYRSHVCGNPAKVTPGSSLAVAKHATTVLEFAPATFVTVLDRCTKDFSNWTSLYLPDGSD